MGSERKTILLIQFDMELQGVHRRAFLREGWEVRTASSIQEARERALERPVDAVMLDPDLLDGHGLDIIPELRKLTGGAPVLALSSSYLPAENRTKAMENGAADFLPQPCDPKALCEKMRALLYACSTGQEAEPHPPLTIAGGGNRKQPTAAKNVLLEEIVEDTPRAGRPPRRAADRKDRR